MLYCFRYALIAVWVESKCFCSRWAAYNSLKLCPYRLVVRTPGSHPGNRSSILREGTNTELNGFFKAKRWDARSASHWFPPIFPNEFRILGALARTDFSPRRRFEQKISLAQTFLAKCPVPQRDLERLEENRKKKRCRRSTKSRWYTIRQRSHEYRYPRLKPWYYSNNSSSC